MYKYLIIETNFLPTQQNDCLWVVMRIENAILKENPAVKKYTTYMMLSQQYNSLFECENAEELYEKIKHHLVGEYHGIIYLKKDYKDSITDSKYFFF